MKFSKCTICYNKFIISEVKPVAMTETDKTDHRSFVGLSTWSPLLVHQSPFAINWEDLELNAYTKDCRRLLRPVQWDPWITRRSVWAGRKNNSLTSVVLPLDGCKLILPLPTFKDARQLRRCYHRTRLPSDCQAWVNYKREWRQQEKTFWNLKLAEHSDQSNKLWKTMSSMLGTKRVWQPAKSTVSAQDLFDFFNEKVASVRRDRWHYSPDCRHFFQQVRHLFTSLKPAWKKRLKKP